MPGNRKNIGKHSTEPPVEELSRPIKRLLISNGQHGQTNVRNNGRSAFVDVKNTDEKAGRNVPPMNRDRAVPPVWIQNMIKGVRYKKKDANTFSVYEDISGSSDEVMDSELYRNVHKEHRNNQKIVQQRQQRKDVVSQQIIRKLQMENLKETSKEVTAMVLEIEKTGIFCDEYNSDHFKYLLYLEGIEPLRERYLIGSQITERMRMVGFELIVDLIQRYDFKQETFYVCTSLLDHTIYKKRHTLSTKLIKPYAITCLFLGSKFEEVLPASLENLSKCLNIDNEMICAIERDILKTTQWFLGRPHPLQFIRRLTHFYNETTHILAKAIAEFTVQNYSTCHIPSSRIAATAVYIATYLEKYKFPKDIQELSDIKEEELYMYVPVIALATLKMLKYGPTRSSSTVVSRKTYSRWIRPNADDFPRIFTPEHIERLQRFVSKTY